MNDNQVEVEFISKIGDLTEGIKQSHEQIEGLKAKVVEFGEAVGAAYALDTVSEWVSELTKVNVQMEKTQAILGVNGEQAAALDLIAQASGTSLDGMTFALNRMSLGLQTADSQSSRLGAAFRVLGIDARTFTDLPTDRRLEVLAEKFSVLQDGPAKAALAMEIFGRSGAAMIPILNRGTEGLKMFEEMSKRAGDNTEPYRAALDAMNFQTMELTKSTEGLGLAIVGDLSPGIVAMETGISGFLQEMRKAAQDTNGWGAILGDLNSPLKWVGEQAILLGRDFSNFGVQVNTVIDEAKLDFHSFSEAWERDVTAAKVENEGLGQAFNALNHLIVDGFDETLSGAGKFFSALVEMAHKAVSAIGAGFYDMGAVMGNAMTGNLSGAGAAFDRMKADFGSVSSEISQGWQKAIESVDFSKTKGDLGDLEAGIATTKTGLADELTALADLGKALNSNNTTGMTEFEAHAQKLIDQNNRAAQKLIDQLDHPETLPGNRNQNQKAPSLDLSKNKADLSSGADEVSALEDTVKRKRMVLDDELKNHSITSQEWLNQTKQMLDFEYNAEMAAYSKELHAANLTAQQKQEILHKEQLAHQKYMDEVLKAELKVRDEVVKAWQDATTKIGSALGNSLKGLVTGSMTPIQALMSALNQLASDGIDVAIKMAEKWVSGEAAKTAASTAGAAARTGIAATESAASSASTVESFIKSITGSAGEAFAGVTGFLAPVMGPAAVGPAAATQATVMSVGLASVYDSGSWSVPGDMVAGIHKGEMIIPQRGGVADEFRSFMANGGFGGKGGSMQSSPDVHLHVHALDAQSFVGYLRSNGRELAKLVKTQFNANPSLQPSY